MKQAHGYIECQFQWYNGWQGVFPIEEPLNDRVRVFFAKLFDIDNQTALRPVAARRGLPSDLSEQAKQSPSYKPDEIFGESYVSFKEVQAVTRGHMSNPVNAIVDSMEKLVNTHGEHNVRLVVWFSDDGHSKSW